MHDRFLWAHHVTGHRGKRECRMSFIHETFWQLYSRTYCGEKITFRRTDSNSSRALQRNWIYALAVSIFHWRSQDAWEFNSTYVGSIPVFLYTHIKYMSKLYFLPNRKSRKTCKQHYVISFWQLFQHLQHFVSAQNVWLILTFLISFIKKNKKIILTDFNKNK